MVRLRRTSFSILATLSLLPATAIAHSEFHLFARQNAPGCLANFTKCAQAGFPSNFCCPNGSTCNALAGNTTVLCCPAGSNCDTIAPIICEIERQDASRFPNATLKTTALEGVLGRCGARCCPFGYTCNAQNNCAKNVDQNVPPTLSSSIPAFSSATPSPTTSLASPPILDSPTSSPTNTPTSAPNTSPTALPTTSCPQFPTVSILVFFFVGFVTGVALTLIVLCLLGQRKKRQAMRRSSTLSFGDISSPRLQSESGVRTDFLRKVSPSTPSTFVGSSGGGSPGRRRTIKRVKSLFSRERSVGGEKELRVVGGVPAVPPLRLNKTVNTNPVTPPQQTAQLSRDRDTGYGDIDIYTDNTTANSLRAGNQSSNPILTTPTPAPLNPNPKPSHHRNDTAGLGIGGGGGLLPPPVFRNEKAGDRGSDMTTWTAMVEGGGNVGQVGDGERSGSRERERERPKKEHERTLSGSSGLAGLPPKGIPYVYKGVSSPTYSDGSLSRR